MGPCWTAAHRVTSLAAVQVRELEEEVEALASGKEHRLKLKV